MAENVIGCRATGSARSPSPAPRYEVRNQSLLAAPGGWTRFSTRTSLSSVRTFASSPKSAWPAETVVPGGRKRRPAQPAFWIAGGFQVPSPGGSTDGGSVFGQ